MPPRFSLFSLKSLRTLSSNARSRVGVRRGIATAIGANLVVAAWWPWSTTSATAKAEEAKTPSSGNPVVVEAALAATPATPTPQPQAEGAKEAAAGNAEAPSESGVAQMYKYQGDDAHPKVYEDAVLTFAPNVPPPITRDYPVVLRVNLDSIVVESPLTNKYKYPFWTFNGRTPGPFIRTRVGDVIEVVHTNKDQSGMPHNIDFHAATGPGGGAPLTFAEMNETKVSRFTMTSPGLFIYHCGAAPVPIHIANGMYGLLLVEPEKGLPKADKEFYVVQSEFYYDTPEGNSTSIEECSYSKGLMEQPDTIVFNGREGAMTQKEVLKANTDEKVRFYFGNAGPNLHSAFHVIGGIFDKVWRDGDLISPPAQGVAVTSVPPGGATVVEFTPKVPGTYTFIDHAIFRLDKGAVGFLNVAGKPRPDLYSSRDPPKNCIGCKLHN